MGGNNSYNKAVGEIPIASRTHTDNGNRIDGHKVIVQKQCPRQVKVPMNSNSESPLYLCAQEHKDKSGNKWSEVKSIGIYENHRIVGQIDLKFDKSGNVLPFADSESGSHFHRFIPMNDTGGLGRKSHDSSNHLPIPKKYIELIGKIESYNKNQKQGR